MIGITNAGGGKDRLQFRLFAGQNPPNNPKTNDVFVRTNVLPVNEWQLRGEGHPLGWLEKENDIVIQTDSTPGSPVFVDLINDTRGGRIYETFKSCVQQVSGKWVKRDAYIWWANRWQQFSSAYNGDLFYSGNQYTEYTGGWVSTANCQNGWYVDGDEKWIWPHAPALEINTHMKIWQTSNPWVGTVFTGKPVDMANYKRLYVNMQYNCIGAGLNNGFNICVTKSNGNNFIPLAEYNVDTANGNKSYDGTISIDLSSISGPVYVAIASHQHGGVDAGNNIVIIRRIWRE